MIYLGADHRGYQLKERIKKYLLEQGQSVEDLGAFVEDKNDDYPEYAQKVGVAVAKSPKEHKGIVICGSGVGVDVAANKVDGVIAGLLFNKDQAIDATSHDQLNVAALPADHLSYDQSVEIVHAFLTTPYSKEERHERRVKEIKKIEEES